MNTPGLIVEQVTINSKYVKGFNKCIHRYLPELGPLPIAAMMLQLVGMLFAHPDMQKYTHDDLMTLVQTNITDGNKKATDKFGKVLKDRNIG